ncbi:hypothetical protein NIES4071_15970 [Calothrix sp. NIES-4071]|nr:hypothetical protein NIES4071_15970 [Calothrix sp. NIES-4071]BAZ55934.1 hypothetical protein NIES4105_15920 [Calothrix sp. NIES-4105]
MQYQVFVQSNPENKFIASVVGIPNCSVVGSTRKEAIEIAHACLEDQLANGDLVTIEVQVAPNRIEDDPLIKNIGIFADDQTFDDFLAEIAAYRQQVDAQEVLPTIDSRFSVR